jgi:acyl dehydratase
MDRMTPAIGPTGVAARAHSTPAVRQPDPCGRGCRDGRRDPPLRHSSCCRAAFLPGVNESGLFDHDLAVERPENGAAPNPVGSATPFHSRSLAVRRDLLPMNNKASVVPFEDLYVGLSTTKTFVVSRGRVLDFANSSNDHNPLHVDPEFARQTPFKFCIAHGMLIASFISGMLSNEFPGHGTVFVALNDVKFERPVFVGSEVDVELRVSHMLGLHKSGKWGQVMFGAETRLRSVPQEAIDAGVPDQTGKVVLLASARVLAPMRNPLALVGAA